MFKLIMALALLAGLLGFVNAAKASEYLKCTQQAINPYKGRPMSAGSGTQWIKKDGDKLTVASEFEFMQQAYASLQGLKK